ncbi:MAG: S1C family serine protease [Bacillus sp. (in: firmicutes)]
MSYNNEYNDKDFNQTSNDGDNKNINDELEQTKHTKSVESFESESHQEKEDNSTRNESVETRQLDNNGEKKNKKLRKIKGKGIVTAIAGGLVGTMLTFSILPFTDYADIMSSSNSEKSNSSYLSKDAVTVQTSSFAVSDIADMVEEAAPAIVGIVNIQQSQSSNNYFNPQQGSTEESVESGSGSGVIFKKDDKYAYIVTNNHVIENADTIEISLDSGESTTAELVGADALSDLAVLKIDASYATAVLEFGDSSTLRAGEQVVAIGNPLGLDLSRTVTQGIVSGVDRTVTVETSAGEWDLNVIQTDAAINPGNSGGALLNTAGQVIGINSLKISSEDTEGLGFAIPSEEFIPIINELLEKGTVERVYLGVGLASLADIPQFYLQNLPEDLEGGVMVTSVDSNSAAAAAGIQVQDVIVSINDTAINTSTELRKYLYSNLKAGDQAEIQLYRSGELMTVTVTLTSNTGVTN